MGHNLVCVPYVFALHPATHAINPYLLQYIYKSHISLRLVGYTAMKNPATVMLGRREGKGQSAFKKPYVSLLNISVVLKSQAINYGSL